MNVNKNTQTNNSKTTMFAFIELSKRQSHEVFTLLYKRQGKANLATESVKIQSVLCEDSLCLKRIVVV